MLMDIPVLVNLEMIRQRRQLLIDENLMKQNRKRYDYNYSVGDAVLMRTIEPRKLDPRAHGPYIITRVYTNGNVDIRRGLHIVERINIRRIMPFKQ